MLTNVWMNRRYNMGWQIRVRIYKGQYKVCTFWQCRGDAALLCYAFVMSNECEIIIDMDQLMDDPQVLEKFHECANLMIQSSNRGQVQSGYRMLEIVDQCLARLHEKANR